MQPTQPTTRQGRELRLTGHLDMKHLVAKHLVEHIHETDKTNDTPGPVTDPGNGILAPPGEVAVRGYWGLHRIARRMGWRDGRTVLRNAVIKGFPIYKRFRFPNPNNIWYTDEGLIQLWQWAQCKLHRNEYLLKMTASKRWMR